MRTTLLAALLMTAAPLAAVAQDRWREADYRDALCAGMEMELTLPDGGGRADCSDGVHIIEVDWADNFKEAVGQVIIYSLKSDLIPGLVLICRRREALCLQHGLNAEESMAAFGAESVIWRCGGEARSLSDCLEIRIDAKP